MLALKTLSGGAFVHQTFQIEDDFATAGVAAIPGAAADAGVQNPTTTSLINVYGHSVDTATGDTGDLLTLIINPDLVLRAKFSGGATSDTALTIATAGTSASTTVDNITGLVPNSPDIDDGVVWGYNGSNVGVYRAIIAADANTITVRNTWPTTPSSGDEFLTGSRAPGGLLGVQLTSAFDQVDGTAESPQGNTYAVLDGEFRGVDDAGTTNSFLHIVASLHAFS
jgi:hypothetical protein